MFSASSETRDRNAPTNANQIRLQTSRIRQGASPDSISVTSKIEFPTGTTGIPSRPVGVDTRRQARVERERRRGHRKCAESLPQALQGRELRKDAGETGVTRSSSAFP